jgi:hypothetical protein
LQPALINRKEYAKIIKPLGTSGFLKGESVLKKVISLKPVIVLTGLLMIITASGLAYSATVNVSTTAQLVNALNTANSSGGNTTILLSDGTYTLSQGLWITAPYITVAGQSGNRQNVIIQGDAMSSSASVQSIFSVTGSHFEVRDLTMQKCRNHIIQVKGENNADYAVVRNCVLRNSYEQLLKVSVDLNNTSIAGDNGLVEGCLFEYSAGVGPQYYIGGVDAHAAKNWVVRGNTFRNIISPSGSVAEFAVHFWSNSANNTVEKNLIINCDRGIGFGLDTRPNTGGIIRNNMIYHAANKGQFADVAIALTESPDTQVYNNTVFMENDFPWAIEYRFASTRNVLIVNNLTNKPIMSRDGSSGTASNNATNADGSWFVNLSSGDLHLASAVNGVADSAQTVSGLTEDFDGEIRPQGNGNDIGADEFSTGDSTAPQPPKNLHIIN